MEKLSNELEKLVFNNKEIITDKLFKDLMELSKKTFEKENEEEAPLYKVRLICMILEKEHNECDCGFQDQEEGEDVVLTDHRKNCSIYNDGSAQDKSIPYTKNLKVNDYIVQAKFNHQNGKSFVLEHIKRLEDEIEREGMAPLQWYGSLFENLYSSCYLPHDVNNIDKINDRYVRICHCLSTHWRIIRIKKL